MICRKSRHIKKKTVYYKQRKIFFTIKKASAAKIERTLSSIHDYRFVTNTHHLKASEVAALYKKKR